MKLSLSVLLGLVAVCQCNVLSVRQAESESNSGPRQVIILRQFEEWLRLVQASMTRLSSQFNRIVNPNKGLSQRISGEDLSEVKETLRDIDVAIAGLNGLLARDAGALQSDQNKDYSGAKVPLVGDLEDMLKLAQKQITDVSSTITKALTGGLNLQGTTAEEMNKVNGGTGPVMSGVPFIKEFEEYLELFQRQINRLGGTIQKVISPSQSK